MNHAIALICNLLGHCRHLMQNAFYQSASICQRTACSELFISQPNWHCKLSSVHVSSFLHRHEPRQAQQVLCSPCWHHSQCFFNSHAFQSTIDTGSYIVQDSCRSSPCSLMAIFRGIDYYALFELAAATILQQVCPLYFCATTAGLVFEKLKRFEQSQSKYSEKSLIIQDLAEFYYILCNHV